MSEDLKVQQDVLMREIRSHISKYNDAMLNARAIGVHPSVLVDEDGLVEIAAFWLELKG